MFLDLVDDVCDGDKKSSPTHERYCCPFCGEDDYKFYIENSEPFLAICFKCEFKGNPITFTKEYYGVNYREAIDILKGYDYDIDNLDVSKFNSQYRDEELTEGEKILLAISNIKNSGSMFSEEKDTTKTKVMPALPTTVKFFVNEVGNAEAQPFLDYLARRGVTAQDIMNHSMGYVTEGAITMGKGTDLTLKNHVVFITFSSSGEPLYWNTRAIESTAFIKSFNAPSLENEHGKNDTVFNFNRAMTTGKIIINEGVFDALTCGDSGVATFGKQVTDEQVALMASALDSRPDTKYYVFLDRDAYDKGDRLAERLHKYTDNVYLVLNTTDYDANDLGKEKVKGLIDNALPFTPANRIKYLMYREKK